MLHDVAPHDHAEDANVVSEIQRDGKTREFVGERSPISQRSAALVIEHLDGREREVSACSRKGRQRRIEMVGQPDVVFVEERQVCPASGTDGQVSGGGGTARATAQVDDVVFNLSRKGLDQRGGCPSRMVVDDERFPASEGLRFDGGQRFREVTFTAMRDNHDAYRWKSSLVCGAGAHDEGRVERTVLRIRSVVNALKAARQLTVSVVIPCHNQAQFLPRTLEGVQAQSTPTDVVVVDDGSSDDVAAVCARYSDVRYLRQPHRGLSAARNRGVNATRGELVHFLDADDVPGIGMYATLARSLCRHSEWTAAVASTRVMHEDGRPSTLHIAPPVTGNLFPLLARKNLFPPGAVLVRRTAIERIGMFDEALDATADWDLWLRVARTGAVFGAVPSSAFHYRTSPISMSRRQPLAMLEAQREILLRATRPDARVSGVDARFAHGLPNNLDEASATCAASALGLAIGHRRGEEIRDLLQRFACYLGDAHLTEQHLQTILVEASITLGFLPADRARTRRACAGVLEAQRATVADPRQRNLLSRILDFLDSGLLTTDLGEPIVPVPVSVAMSTVVEVAVAVDTVTSISAVIAPWRAEVNGTVRLRVFDEVGRVLLRETVALVDGLSSARKVHFHFEPLPGLAGRRIIVELTPDTTRPIAVYEPVRTAKQIHRRILRKLACDRRGTGLWCQLHHNRDGRCR